MVWLCWQIESAFFDPNKQDEPSPAESNDVRREVLVVARHQRRAKMTNDVRSKCLVKPRLVFEQGIHHVSKPIMASWGTVKLDPSLAIIHHHRPCNPTFHQDCTVFVDDVSAVRFADRLMRAVNDVTRAFNVSVVDGLWRQIDCYTGINCCCLVHNRQYVYLTTNWRH